MFGVVVAGAAVQPPTSLPALFCLCRGGDDGGGGAALSPPRAPQHFCVCPDERGRQCLRPVPLRVAVVLVAARATVSPPRTPVLTSVCLRVPSRRCGGGAAMSPPRAPPLQRIIHPSLPCISGPSLTLSRTRNTAPSPLADTAPSTSDPKGKKRAVREPSPAANEATPAPKRAKGTPKSRSTKGKSKAAPAKKSMPKK
jgi:hypothetical protein